MKHNTHFFTGFPGFLTSHIIDELLAKHPNDKVVALVTRRSFSTAQKKIQNNNWESRVELVIGDITQDDLGIDNPGLLLKRLTYVWHLAAIYDLAVKEEVAHRVNVTGTQKIIEFTASIKNLVQFNYISTCYVAGKREGLIFEDELDEGQSHNNFYESTKFLAEIEVQKSTLPFAIFRPAIIVGDSRSGKTEKFDGPYYLFKLLNELPSWLPSLNVRSGTSGVNIIPIDFATKAILALGTDDQSKGQVFHICDSNPMVPTEIISLSLKSLGKKPAAASIPNSIFKRAAESRNIEKITGVPKEVLNYFTYNAAYDASNATRLLAGYGISCPHLSSYLPILIDYYETH